MMRRSLLVTTMLLALTGTAQADEAPECQAIMDRYATLQAADDSLPPLFEDRFEIADLKPFEIDGQLVGGRMEQAPFAVKNHEGYLECLIDGSFAVASVCANLVPESEDPYLPQRFQVISQALLHSLQDEAGVSRTAVATLISEAGKSLQAALVRGDSYPQGTSVEETITESLYAKVATIPETAFGPAQMCFLAEFYEE